MAGCGIIEVSFVTLLSGVVGDAGWPTDYGLCAFQQSVSATFPPGPTSFFDALRLSETKAKKKQNNLHETKLK